jgi:NTP pyrophosphatase (non-canonical NTP hydrolase)
LSCTILGGTQLDEKITISELKNKVKNFCDERDWNQYHNAKELVTAMIIETSELLEHFRWKSHKESDDSFKDEKKLVEIKDEMADVFYFLLRLAQRYDIDLSEALENKLKKNHEKYPVEKFKGSHKKYNEI